MKQLYFSFFLMLGFISISNAQPGLEPDTIIVQPGWNLVASKFTGSVSDIVTTEPPGIIASAFYSFSVSGGYSAADTLKESSGYWVKISQQQTDGELIIIFSPPSRPFICGLPLRGRVWYADKWYKSVQIGSQCWLKQNLDVGTFKIAWLGNQTNDGVVEKYCYGDDSSNCDPYGGLYQWGEAMQYVTTPGAQGICPNGWHIPTYEEFLTLKANVSDDGNALKTVGSGTGAGAGTNTSKFSALLAGYKGIESSFLSLNEATHFWSSTLYSSGSPYYLRLEDDNSNIELQWIVPIAGHSVRCIKN